MVLRRFKMEGMAAVESLDSADPTDAAQWFVVRGSLKASDLMPLLVRTMAAHSGDVTLDLLSLDHLTAGGCWTIRNLAEDLWRQGRLLTVLFPPGGPTADMLRSSGTIDHPRAAFRASPLP